MSKFNRRLLMGGEGRKKVETLIFSGTYKSDLEDISWNESIPDDITSFKIVITNLKIGWTSSFSSYFEFEIYVHKDGVSKILFNVNHHSIHNSTLFTEYLYRDSNGNSCRDNTAFTLFPKIEIVFDGEKNGNSLSGIVSAKAQETNGDIIYEVSFPAITPDIPNLVTMSLYQNREQEMGADLIEFYKIS